jgi:hypothetical protein
LFRLGCTVNGLQCLAVKAVAREEDLGGSVFRFTVQRVDDRFLVQELPVYA